MIFLAFIFFLFSPLLGLLAGVLLIEETLLTWPLLAAGALIFYFSGLFRPLPLFLWSLNLRKVGWPKEFANKIEELKGLAYFHFESQNLGFKRVDLYVSGSANSFLVVLRGERKKAIVIISQVLADSLEQRELTALILWKLSQNSGRPRFFLNYCLFMLSLGFQMKNLLGLAVGKFPFLPSKLRYGLRQVIEFIFMGGLLIARPLLGRYPRRPKKLSVNSMHFEDSQVLASALGKYRGMMDWTANGHQLVSIFGSHLNSEDKLIFNLI